MERKYALGIFFSLLFVVMFMLGFARAAELQAWVPKDMIEGSGAVTAWVEKERCEAAGKGECFDISKCELSECKIGAEEVDDLSKPLYKAKSKVVACADKKDCIMKAQPVCDEGGKNCVQHCPVDENLIFSKDWTELYCTKLVGYEKKLVRKMVVDEVKKAAKQAAKDAAIAKDTKLKKAVQDLKKAAKDWATLNAAQKDAALKDVLTVLLKD